MKETEIPVAPIIDEIFCFIKQWSAEKGLTIDTLKKIFNSPKSAVEGAVCELERVHMISVDPDNGKIRVSGDNPYDSYAWYVALNMKILNRSFESFIHSNPDMTGIIKAKLLSLPASCIEKKKWIIPFLMFFKNDDSQEVENKRSEIRSSIEKRETWEMPPSFFQEWLESEIMTFIYFSRIAILNCPSGVVWGDDIYSFFVQIGYRKEDIENKLGYLCSVDALRFENGKYKVQEDKFNVWSRIYNISTIEY